MSTYDDDAERMAEVCEYCGELNFRCICDPDLIELLDDDQEGRDLSKEIVDKEPPF